MIFSHRANLKEMEAGILVSISVILYVKSSVWQTFIC